MTLLGASIASCRGLEKTLQKKLEMLFLLEDKLQFMPAHDALFLVTKAISTYRVNYLLRTSRCAGCPLLDQYDSQLRSMLSSITNLSITDSSRKQAMLPRRWGGLGIRSTVMLAPSAFTASAAGARTLMNKILPSQYSDIIDAYMQAAVTDWTTRFPDIIEIPPIQGTHKQQAWDDYVCRKAFDELLNGSADTVSRARLLAAKADHSAIWMEAVPIASIGLKLNNETLRIAIGLRLGSNLTIPRECRCGAQITADGRHGLVCRRGGGRMIRHRLVNDAIHRAFASA